MVISDRLARLFLCIGGIYTCFIVWGVLQERISTVAYGQHSDEHFLGTGIHLKLFQPFISFSKLFHSIISFLVPHSPTTTVPSRFSSFVFLNFCQCLTSTLVAWIILKWVKKDSGGGCSRGLLALYLRIALCYCCASPFGYYSLKYLSYVTMNLGKSCKLLPLILANIFVRKRAIGRTKLASLLLVTAGVAGFMVFDSGHGKTSSGQPNNLGWIEPILGLALLSINLLMDALMNAFQDEVFARYSPSPFDMMFHQNWISGALILGFMLLPFGEAELTSALEFVAYHPDFFRDLILFVGCGAVGQAFVFYTIETFGTLSLVTVTVTRKLFTILLSVFCFGHALNLVQWMCVALVFVALSMEKLTLKRPKRLPGSVPKDE